MNINTTASLNTGGSAKKGGGHTEERRVGVFLPAAANKSEEYVECCINGAVYVIRRGCRVMVPEPVAVLLKSRGIIAGG
jgi:hypothetical protein